MPDITFGRRTYFESKGRNGFVATTGVSLTRIGRSGEADDCVFIEPINSRGHLSDAARVVVAFDALPEVIKTLQELAGSEVDTSDIPEADESFFQRAKLRIPVAIDTAKRALAVLEDELYQRQTSGNGEEFGCLEKLVEELRTAIPAAIP